MKDKAIKTDISLEEYTKAVNKKLIENNCPEDEIKFIMHFSKAKIQRFWEMGIEPELAAKSLTNN